MGRLWQWQRGWVIIGALVGVWSAQWNIALPWLLGAITDFFTCLLAIMLMREEYFWSTRFKIPEIWRRIISTGKVGLDCVQSSPAMRFIVCFQVILTFGVMTVNMQWQIFFGRFYTGVIGNGYIWFGIGMMLFLGAKLSSYWKSVTGSAVNAICMALIFVGVTLTFTPFGQMLFIALPIFLAHSFFRGVWPPIQDAYVNEEISKRGLKDARATILSAISMIEHVAGMSGLIFSGLIAEYISIRAAWISSGILMIISGIMLWREYRFHKTAV